MPGPSLGVRGVDGTDRVVGDKVDPEGFKNERKILETSLFLQTQGHQVSNRRLNFHMLSPFFSEGLPHQFHLKKKIIVKK